jgi:hypothetical protein
MISETSDSDCLPDWELKERNCRSLPKVQRFGIVPIFGIFVIHSFWVEKTDDDDHSMQSRLKWRRFYISEKTRQEADFCNEWIIIKYATTVFTVCVMGWYLSSLSHPSNWFLPSENAHPITKMSILSAPISFSLLELFHVSCLLGLSVSMFVNWNSNLCQC